MLEDRENIDLGLGEKLLPKFVECQVHKKSEAVLKFVLLLLMVESDKDVKKPIHYSKAHHLETEPLLE